MAYGVKLLIVMRKVVLQALMCVMLLVVAAVTLVKGIRES